ncbi:MAG: hypothetical protein HQ541_17705 [Mariniphaga sp.]|nr:hypothetical protein [Mariniphaga sp.]
MKNLLLIGLIVISFSTSVFCQVDNTEMDKLNTRISTLENNIETVQIENAKILEDYSSLKNLHSVLKKNYNQLSNELDNYKMQSQTDIDSISNNTNTNTDNIDKIANELDVNIENVKKYTKQSITNLNKTVSQNTLYWIIAVLVVALFVLLVFVLLRKQIFKQKSDYESNLQNTQKAFDVEIVKLDNKLNKLKESLEILKEKDK